MVKVLIIEDQDMARVALSVVLSKNPNIEIQDMAVDGQEGVDKALALKPDLVIMDIGLPTIDGIEATRQIKLKSVKGKTAEKKERFEGRENIQDGPGKSGKK